MLFTVKYDFKPSLPISLLYLIKIYCNEAFFCTGNLTISNANEVYCDFICVIFINTLFLHTTTIDIMAKGIRDYIVRPRLV